MSDKTDKKERRSWWMQFVISVLGTAIGVGLTFAISHRIENRKQEQAQRMTAMMVIHDIDETVDQLKLMKSDMDKMYNAMLFTMQHLDQLDSVPNDTLYLAINYIIADDQEFHFDMSKEKIFHSSPDTWQNLGSMKFIDNVQSFYFERQSFQEMRNKSSYWQKPVNSSELEKIQMFNKDNLNVEEYLNRYNALLRDLLKEKLNDDHVKYYIEASAWRISVILNYMDIWTKMNDENKFLMSITDEELEDYVNSIERYGIALTDNSLIGTWTSSSIDENVSEWNFMKDQTFSHHITNKSPVNLPFSQGNLIINIIETGNWTLEGDSLILIYDLDSFQANLDASELIAMTGRQELLDNWIQDNDKIIYDYYKNIVKTNIRIANKVRLDASQDKMEVRYIAAINESAPKEEYTLYLKRKR